MGEIATWRSCLLVQLLQRHSLSIQNAAWVIDASEQFDRKSAFQSAGSLVSCLSVCEHRRLCVAIKSFSYSFLIHQHARVFVPSQRKQQWRLLKQTVGYLTYAEKAKVSQNGGMLTCFSLKVIREASIWPLGLCVQGRKTHLEGHVPFTHTHLIKLEWMLPDCGRKLERRPPRSRRGNVCKGSCNGSKRKPKLSRQEATRLIPKIKPEIRSTSGPQMRFTSLVNSLEHWTTCDLWHLRASVFSSLTWKRQERYEFLTFEDNTHTRTHPNGAFTILLQQYFCCTYFSSLALNANCPLTPHQKNPFNPFFNANRCRRPGPCCRNVRRQYRSTFGWLQTTEHQLAPSGLFVALAN